jgi:hypothetical protein
MEVPGKLWHNLVEEGNVVVLVVFEKKTSSWKDCIQLQTVFEADEEFVQAQMQLCFTICNPADVHLVA